LILEPGSRLQMSAGTIRSLNNLDSYETGVNSEPRLCRPGPPVTRRRVTESMKRAAIRRKTPRPAPTLRAEIISHLTLNLTRSACSVSLMINAGDFLILPAVEQKIFHRQGLPGVRRRDLSAGRC
jgi:hypothetical protein